MTLLSIVCTIVPVGVGVLGVFLFGETAFKILKEEAHHAA